MKKHLPSMLTIALFLLANYSFAQSSSEQDQMKTQASVNTSATQDQKAVSADIEIPSSLKFLVEFCELKDGIYYLPKKKFNELTLDQQNYLLNNKTKFLIKEEK